MKIRLLLATICLTAGSTVNGQHHDVSGYLTKVLSDLQKIESATYHSEYQSWTQWDKEPRTRYEFFHEFDNPADTALDAAYVRFDASDTTTLTFGYDGQIRATVDNNEKKIVIDDFTYDPLPFRRVFPPFFNYCKNILRYCLQNQDNSEVEFADLGEDYHLRLTVMATTPLEFFGRGPQFAGIPDPSGEMQPSVYEVWIRKSENRPYKVLRDVSTNGFTMTLSNVRINETSIDDLNVYDYFPTGHEVQAYRPTRNNAHNPDKPAGRKAPEWNLQDMNSIPVSLSDFNGKVVVIQFTGIGCGPCQVSIPYLTELRKQYSPDVLEIVSIETWMRKPETLRNYATKYKINYTFLCADDEVAKTYEAGRLVPVFFILDKEHTIRKKIEGYGPNTSEEIGKTIESLL